MHHVLAASPPAQSPAGTEAETEAGDAPVRVEPGAEERGRELATARAMLGEFIDYVDARGAHGYAATWVHGAPVTISLDVLRALAAPAETRAGSEVGNVPPLWWSPTRGVIQADEDAYSTVRSAGWTLVAHLPDDAVRLAAAPPAPGEAVSDGVVLGTLARAAEWSDDPYLADEEKMQVVLDVLREHRMQVVAASPPAPGEGQGATEGGELVRSPEWWAAVDRDRRRFANDRDLCQDCGFVEACDCRRQWSAPAGPQAEGAGETDDPEELQRRINDAHRKIAELHAVAYPDQSGPANGATS